MVTPAHRAYDRRWFQRVSTYWWLWQPSYLAFILRELSSVPVAYFVVLTLVKLNALNQGPVAYAAFQQWRWYFIRVWSVDFSHKLPSRISLVGCPGNRRQEAGRRSPSGFRLPPARV